MNQTFLSFTFKSEAPTFLLFETGQGAEIDIDAGQSITFDQIDDVIEALKAIKASGDKKQGNGEGKREDNEQEEVISYLPILPPFNFNTPEKLAALIGRKVELRDGSVHIVKVIDDSEDALTGIDTAIGLGNRKWVFTDGSYLGVSCESPEDIVKVLPTSN